MSTDNKLTNEILDEICEEITTSSKGLVHILKKHKITPKMFYNKVRDAGPDRDKYTLAKEMQAHFLFDEIIEIADHTDEDHTPFTGTNVVNRDKIRMEARKWAASKLLPKKYGDKLEVENNINIIPPLFPDVKEIEE